MAPVFSREPMEGMVVEMFRYEASRACQCLSKCEGVGSMECRDGKLCGD